MFGNRPVIGAEVQQALEQFQMTDERIKSLGAENLMPAFSVTCQDHEGGAAVKFQQWKDGKWVEITDWIETDDGLVRPMVEKSAAAYSKEKGTAMRDCASVS